MAPFPAWKRALDLAIAIPSLAILALVLAGTFAIMRLTRDDGGVLHRAVRVGEAGRPFTLYKIRSMRSDGTGPAITAAADARVTRIGRVMRRTKLDELPQLLNVVRGEMSLVGPRPEDPRFVDWRDPLHAAVFSRRPGITGLAQLRFRAEEELIPSEDAESFYRRAILPVKLQLDAEYLASQSPGVDGRLLFETLAALLPGRRRPSGPLAEPSGRGSTSRGGPAPG